MSQVRRPCLEEEWFVRDGLISLDGLCPGCRRDFEGELRSFADDNAAALSKIYRLSRSIHVQAILRGDARAAREATHWDVVIVLRTMRALIGKSIETFVKQGLITQAPASTRGERA
jgi:hypothetical protein